MQAGGFSEDARAGAEDSLLAARITRLGRCVYTPSAVVYHRARGNLQAVFRWFVRRGQSEIGYWLETDEPWKSAWYLLRSSWVLRLAGLVIVVINWPTLAVIIPAGVMAYYATVLWRFRYARAYPNHRRAWWIVPVVKMIMDIGTEVGRWRALVHRRSVCTP